MCLVGTTQLDSPATDILSKTQRHCATALHKRAMGKRQNLYATGMRRRASYRQKERTITRTNAATVVTSSGSGTRGIARVVPSDAGVASPEAVAPVAAGR